MAENSKITLGEMHMQVAEQEPKMAPTVDRILDTIYNWVYHRDIRKQYNQIDEMIINTKPLVNYDLDILIGILVATLPCKYHLRRRSAFFSDVHMHITLNYPEEDAEELLVGLE